MAGYSSIEWTEATWNPVTGCSPISDGCDHCYARRMAKRLKAMGNKRYVNGFKVTIHYDLITTPLSWKKPRLIFVNSMSDLFHEKVPDSFIKSVFEVMSQTPQHIFQVLTKRAERLVEIAPYLTWSENIWMGVTVESGKYDHRIDLLKKVPAHLRFLSIEPMIGSLDNLDLKGISWVIVGGESGPGARLVKESWVKSIRDKCQESEIPFFFKQWGGFNKKKAGRLLEGKEWSQYPSQKTKLKHSSSFI